MQYADAGNVATDAGEAADPRSVEFDRAVGIAAGNATRTRTQFHGEPAGSFVLERQMTFFERFTSKFTQVGRFLVTRGSTLAAVGLDGTPMAGLEGVPRGTVALVVAPHASLTNSQIPGVSGGFVGQAQFLGTPVFVVGRTGALFRAGVDGSFVQVR